MAAKRKPAAKAAKPAKAAAPAEVAGAVEAVAPVANGELTRVFVFNGIELADIGTDKSPAEVKDFYATVYPALMNAHVKGPDVVGDRQKWTFQASTGTRG